ncbi:MAG: DUF4340 domain-containing protein [Eggerthellaceae bacterium]|nr:DUF4340 domain-containing protein [Eggerthellaceae bacterium]
MTREKKLYVLLAVLAVVAVGAFVASSIQTSKENIKENGETVLSLDVDSVTAVSWDTGESAFSFHKDDGSWVYDADQAFPVDGGKIDEMLSCFQEFGASYTIEDADDLGQYGLDNPVCTINVAANGEDYAISLGNFSTVDSERYVSLGDGKVHLAKTDPLETFEVELSDLIAHDTVPDITNATAIAFEGAQNYEIAYIEDNAAHTYCADDVYFVGDDPLDTDTVETYLSRIKNLGLSDYVEYNVSDGNLSAYGLDNPELVVTVDYSTDDGETTETFTLRVGRNQEELEKARSSDDEDAEDDVQAYVQVENSRIVYAISHVDYERLTAASYDDLRHQDVVPVDFDQVTSIDVELDGATHTLTYDAEAEAWHCDGAEEEADVSTLKSEITGLTATSFTQEEAAGQEEISLTLHLSNEHYPTVEVKLYRKDGETCLAVIDGESVAYVSRDSVVDIVEAVNKIVL